MLRLLLAATQLAALVALLLSAIELFGVTGVVNSQPVTDDRLLILAAALNPFLLFFAALAASQFSIRSNSLGAVAVSFVVSSAVVWNLLYALDFRNTANWGFWLEVLAVWLLAWACVELLASIRTMSRSLQAMLNLVIPILFGIWLLMLWELLTRGFDVPQVLLPAPSQIGQRFMTSTAILWADFQQTFLKAVLIGYVVGCGAGFMLAILIDRSPFLQRGLLPIGNLVAALPIVGVAPIMVMWFGFDWPSKAAVVIIMTFFPMLVNTVAGLSAAQPMQHDLMKTYAANYWQSLFKLRLPQALPFIFNALKINSTLAMIGAIVAEFFGTPTVGMGFRISTEVGRMNVDMVWAEIAVAAVAGSLFYAVVAGVERIATFWHPSFRSPRCLIKKMADSFQQENSSDKK